MILLWCFLVTVYFMNYAVAFVPLIWRSIKDFPPETVELLLTRQNISLIVLVSHKLMLQRNALSLWVWVWSSWSFILSAWRSMTIIHTVRFYSHVSVWAARPVNFWPNDSLWTGGRRRTEQIYVSLHLWTAAGKRIFSDERRIKQTHPVSLWLIQRISVKEPPELRNNQIFSFYEKKKWQVTTLNVQGN